MTKYSTQSLGMVICFCFLRKRYIQWIKIKVRDFFIPQGDLICKIVYETKFGKSCAFDFADKK